MIILKLCEYISRQIFNYISIIYKHKNFVKTKTNDCNFPHFLFYYQPPPKKPF